MEPNFENLQRLFVTKDDVDRLAERALSTVRKHLALRRKELPTTVFVLLRVFDTGELIHTTVNMREAQNDDDRPRRFKQLGAEYVGSGRMPVAIMTSCEAWAGTPHEPGKQRVRPTHDPARREIVMISGGAIGLQGKALSLQHAVGGILEVRRDRNGNLVPDKFEELSIAHDRLANAFFSAYFDTMLRHVQ